MKRTFYVKALWDAEVNKWYSESDIIGLHIETKTLEDFELVLNDVAQQLIFTNHLNKSDITNRPICDWMPTIIWQKPFEAVAAQVPVGYYKLLIKELARLGFAYDRQAKGSHEFWTNPQTNETATVPFNLDSRHTANAILKQAGSKKKF